MAKLDDGGWKAGRSVIVAAVWAMAAAVSSPSAIPQATGEPQTANASASGSGSTVVPDIDAGAEFYGSECRGCHAASIGPTLRGVLNRPVASVESFTGYSEGLKARKNLSWTAANLDAFLTSPGVFAPGTLMTKAILDAQTRADVIAYLESLPAPRN